MNKFLKVLAATATVMLLAACSAPGDLGETQELTQATAAEYQQLAYLGSQYQLDMLRNPLDFSTASTYTTSGAEVPRPLTALMAKSGVSPQQTTDCAIESGNTLDADNDSIPVSATYTYNCSETGTDFSYSLTGTVTVADKDDADANSGYSMDMTDLEYRLTSGGETITFTFDLAFDLAVAGTRYDATFDLNFAGSGPEGSFDIGFDFVQSYVADDPANHFASGTLTFDGTMSMTSDGQRYSLDASTNPSLAVDELCTTGYRSGSTTYSDNAGNVVEVSFSCDSAVATFNGDQLATY